MLKPILILAVATVGLSASEEGLGFEAGLRASRSGATVRDFGGAWSGTGGSLAATWGDSTLRVRFRADLDTFAGRAGKGPVRSAGLGGDGVIVVPTSSWVRPFISIGGAVQRWTWDPAGNPAGDGKTQAVRFGVRVEAGAYLGERFHLYVGVLRGSIAKDRLVKCPYVGAAFVF